MKLIPETHHDLLKDEARAFASLATTMADGAPQLTPLWFNLDGEDILINSVKGRVKDRNMRERPEVALLIVGLDNPYRYIQVRGRVVGISEEGGVDHIDALSQKYQGKDFNPPEGHVRVIYRIRPEKAQVYDW